MTVRDAIKEIGAEDGLLIMYRMIMPITHEGKVYGSDELIGYCRYKDGTLVPEDHDSYCIDERIDKYELVHDGNEDCLIIWECRAAMEIPISEPWFSMIWSGEKKEEYREIKPYWSTRFRKIFPFVKNTDIPFERNWDTRWVCFRNGYGKSRPSLMAEVTLRRGTGKAEWGAEEGKEYYVLKIHNVYRGEPEAAAAAAADGDV